MTEDRDLMPMTEDMQPAVQEPVSGSGEQTVPAVTEAPEAEVSEQAVCIGQDLPGSVQEDIPQVPNAVPRQVRDRQASGYSAPYYYDRAETMKPKVRLTPDGKPAGERVGFWPRLAAALIDGLVSAVIWLLFIFIASLFTDRLNEPFFFQASLMSVLFYLAVKLYYIFSQWKFQKTLGKRALRLMLISSETYGKPDLWTVFFRETFGKFVSAACVVGDLMLLGKQHLPLYDRLADTEVVYHLPATGAVPPADRTESGSADEAPPAYADAADRGTFER